MELEEHAKSLAKRAKSRVGNVIVAYEVKKWPEGRLEQLLKMRVLRSLPDADEIRCPGCTERHMIVPIRTILPNGEPYSEHLCGKEGLIEIPAFLFKRWQIVIEKMIELGYVAAPIASETDEFITVTEAGILAGVHKGTVSKWADAGQIEHNGVKGRGRKVSKASVLMMKHEREEKQAQGDYEEYRRDIENIPDMH